MTLGEVAERTALATPLRGLRDDAPKVIGVFPASAFHRRPRLFAALRRVLPVEFEPRPEGAFGELDALLVFGREIDAELVPLGLPALVLIQHAEAPLSPDMPVSFSSALELDPRLRSRTLCERTIVAFASLGPSDGVTLASVDGEPVWRTSARAGAAMEIAAVAPSELRADDSLRESMTCGHFLGLLPLFHFLREVTGYRLWERPPLHAAFVVDDPNLHRPRYGYVDFGDLARHAAAHDYHVAMATVPIDTWFTHRRAARIFRAHPDRLSLTVHGNDHRYHELAVPRDDDESLAMFRQATSRLDRFERKTGIPVSRVMIPPHGSCAYELLEPMLLGGFDAYLNGARWWREWPREQRAVAGWSPLTTDAGLPAMSRHFLGHGALLDELVFDALLDKPLVVCGHHLELADRGTRLAEVADWIRSFGAVRWEPLSSLARSTVFTRNDEDGSLRVRSWTRRFAVDVPQDVELLRVELPFPLDGSSLRCNGAVRPLDSAAHGGSLAEIPVMGGERAELQLLPRTIEVDCPQRRAHVSAYIRRGIAESRDRLSPLLRRLRVDRVLRRLELRYDAFMRTRIDRQRALRRSRRA
jgi:hypothetical protein